MSVSVRTIVREMYDCPLLRGGNQDVQVRGREEAENGVIMSMLHPLVPSS